MSSSGRLPTMRVMGRNLIEGIVAIPIAAIALAFGCADSDDMRSGAVPALTCQIEGMDLCTTRLAVVANPGLPPLIEFAAFDLNGAFDTAFAMESCRSRSTTSIHRVMISWSGIVRSPPFTRYMSRRLVLLKLNGIWSFNRRTRSWTHAQPVGPKVKPFHLFT